MLPTTQILSVLMVVLFLTGCSQFRTITADEALTIGRDAIYARFGNEGADRQEPYQVKPESLYWLVEGSLHAPPGAVIPGGPFQAKVSKYGRVFSVMYYE